MNLCRVWVESRGGGARRRRIRRRRGTTSAPAERPEVGRMPNAVGGGGAGVACRSSLRMETQREPKQNDGPYKVLCFLPSANIKKLALIST
jgi:hypothetical protein